MLSGLKIKEEVEKGNIVIENFDSSKKENGKSRLNPNSYNLTLNSKLLVYEEKILDMKKNNKTKELIIPEEGLVLEPGKLYLGQTSEFTSTDKYIPALSGRSSIGRLGIAIHITAGFGDVGFNGKWTLEISCIQPVRIYPNTEICQIYYHTIEGEYELYSSEKYQNQEGVMASKMYKDFE